MKSNTNGQTTTATHRFNVLRSISAFFYPISKTALREVMDKFEQEHLETANILARSRDLCKEVDDEVSSTKVFSAK